MAANAGTPGGELNSNALTAPAESRDDDGPADPEDNAADTATAKSTAPRLALAIGVVVALALAALAGWFGYQTYHSNQSDKQRQLLVQVARQGALNMTTIDWQHADSDVQRILASATGAFYDDFSQRQKPFIDVVKKLQSKTEGTITDAGLESEAGDQARVLIAVSVKSSDSSGAQQPRLYRFRISVQKTGDEAKVSDVEFVP